MIDRNAKLSVTRQAGLLGISRSCTYHTPQPVQEPDLVLMRRIDTCGQFTSTDLLAILVTGEVKISLDGRGAWRDNVFFERLWRTIKHEEVYLRACKSVPEARASITLYLAFSNTRRPHSSLEGKTPANCSDKLNHA